MPTVVGLVFVYRGKYILSLKASYALTSLANSMNWNRNLFLPDRDEMNTHFQVLGASVAVPADTLVDLPTYDVIDWVHRLLQGRISEQFQALYGLLDVLGVPIFWDAMSVVRRFHVHHLSTSVRPGSAYSLYDILFIYLFILFIYLRTQHSKQYKIEDTIKAVEF